MAERLIRESDVIENIDEWLDTVGYATIGKNLSYYAELKGCIADAPTIEAKPVVHAHWKEKWTEESGHELICSNCGEYALMNGEFYSDNSKYCPYCGATMDESILSTEDVQRIEKEMEEAGVKTIKIDGIKLWEENNNG